MSDEFDWDEENLSHIARHNVTREEVEEVFYRDPVIVPGYVKNGEQRYRAHGITAHSRYLTIGYMERNQQVRPITAFDMDRKDKKKYGPYIIQQIYEEHIPDEKIE